MNETSPHAAELIWRLRSEGFAFGYGAGRSTLKQSLTKTKLRLMDAQWAVVEEVSDFAHSICVSRAPFVADAIDANPADYHQIHIRFDDRIHNGLSYTDYIVPLCVLNDEQAWYWWSRHISRHLPTHYQFFRNGNCQPETVCQLIDITPEQKEQCREFYESSEIGRHTSRSKGGGSSIDPHSLGKREACERMLTAGQRDQWNRIKTAGALPESWVLRSDRPAPDQRIEPDDVAPDARRLTELAPFFDSLAECREATLTPTQEGFLERLEAIIRTVLGHLRHRGRCPLSARRDDPQEWATQEVIRYAEVITRQLILTEEQEQLLQDAGEPA